jgi:bacteriocin-like protein
MSTDNTVPAEKLVPEAVEPDEISTEELDQVSGGAIDAYLILTGQKQGTTKKP